VGNILLNKKAGAFAPAFRVSKNPQTVKMQNFTKRKTKSLLLEEKVAKIFDF
jgi:alkylated DNA nucleotide flippase Atl1